MAPNQVSPSRLMLPATGTTGAYREILDDASARAQSYLSAVSNRPVNVTREATNKLASLGGPHRNRARNQAGYCNSLMKWGRPQQCPPWGGASSAV